ALPVTRVKIEHEHFVPVSKHRIRKCLLDEVADPQDHRKFRDFCRIIEAIYHFEYHETQEELKRDFMLFNPVTGPEELRHLSAEEIESAEATFLTNFFKMMDRGNFLALAQHDYDVADQEDFLFSLPVKINYDALDHELLSRYFKEHAQLQERYFQGELPESARRVMIFRRGVGVEKYRGFLLLQKCDVLVDRYLAWLFGLPGALLRLFGGRKSETPVHEPVEKTAPTPEKERSAIFNDRYVERITPKHVTRSLFSLFKRHTIQEPTFVQLVILFRYATPEPRGRNKPAPPKDRSIYIKQFRDIPMADLEVVYPEKKLSMKPVDLLKLGITAIIGIVVFTVKFVLKAATLVALGPVYVVIGLATLVGYGAKVIAGWRNSRNRYEQVVTHLLYHKNLDNDLGVVFFLMDSLEEQEFKEAVLAYYLLWREGPMAIKQLDGRCEKFIKDQFDVEVDFEVDDALDKLLAKKLVTESGGLYHPVGLLEACEMLDQKWDDYFLYNNDKQARETASQDSVDGGPLSPQA
ncbi:MAG: TMEM143 family protein, partial [Planctomycetota bacterium]